MRLLEVNFFEMTRFDPVFCKHISLLIESLPESQIINIADAVSRYTYYELSVDDGRL